MFCGKKIFEGKKRMFFGLEQQKQWEALNYDKVFYSI